MIKRLFQQIKDSRKLFLISVIFGCIGGVVLIAEAAYIARIVDDVFMKGSGLEQVSLWLILLLIIIVIRAVLHMISEYMASKLAQGIKSELRIELIRKIGELGPHYTKQQRKGELTSILYEGIEQLENYLANYVPQIVLSMFVPFAIFTVVVAQDGLSALVYAITLPLLIVFMILIGKYTKIRTDRQLKLLGRLGGHFQEVLRGIETLKMFNRSKDQSRIIGAISEEHRRSTMATLRLAFLSAFVMELFATISTAVIAVFLGLRLVNGQLEFYHALLILLLTPEFYAPIRALGTQFHAGMNGASAATRIFQILDAEPSGLAEQQGQFPPLTSYGADIEFKEVTVWHPDCSAPSLHNVSFKLKAGESLAIVGATGAGKSTILDLLQGFIKPTSGTILINNIPLEQLSMLQWRENITSVSQVTQLFHGTIRENVALGVEQATDEELWVALRKAQAESFVKNLPHGLDTQLTDRVKLSGGQIQRLALARAMLREHTPIILLDEATAGLDAYHEQRVLNQLNAWMKNKTSIIVAHHLQSVASVNLVIVMDQGNIIELGATSQLSKANGRFAKMLKAMKANGVAADYYVQQNQISENKGLELHSFNTVKACNERRMSTESSQQEAMDRLHKSYRTHEHEAVDLEKEDASSDAYNYNFLMFIHSTRRLLKFMASYKWLAIIAVLLSFLTIAANIGLMGTSGYLIAKAALRPENVLMLYVPIVGVRFFGITRGVFRYLERLASHNVTFKVLHKLRVWIYERIEPQGMVLFGRKRSGNVLGSVISDIDQLQSFYLRLVAPPLVYVLAVIVTVSFMYMQHPLLAAAVLVMLVVAGIVIPYHSYRASKVKAPLLAKARIRLYEEMLDLLQGLTTLKQFGKLTMQESKLEQVQQHLNKYQLEEQKKRTIYNGLMTGVTQLAMWLMLLISIPLIREGIIAPYMLPAILLVTLASFEAAAPLPQAFQLSSSVAIAANRLFQLADEQEQLMKEDSRDIKKIDPQKNKWHCTLEDVSFTYDDVSRPALRGINLELTVGKRVAVIGESGAGKSTLLQVILSLRNIQEGKRIINSTSYEQLNDEMIREHFAVVTQQVQLFNATIAENIRLGNADATEEQVIEAAKLAEIHDFIMTLPEGYRTMIGEYGAKLSGGERQRLGLARALVRKSEAILFDEPVTGLDPLTQRAFQSNIEPILQQKATLWITHRLADVVNMDEIIVIRHGQIIERGTHQQLLAQQGYYAQLWWLERSKDWIVAS